MNLNPVKFTEELAKEITTWKYEGDYSIYNLPSWDEVIKKQISLCKKRKEKISLDMQTVRIILLDL
ncbi:hypothetical protein [Paraclostridium sp. AKS81]|uniref:hypothetical protein n=1 Tax=Paraclostridium sp. AKS81 TaxID=2876117 RepID=UPI0021E016D9|nr:hypothetical protein [Paraclostridium sp. AKS81]MCU9811096.1 hypothetical protein [Paraclostridium sp. AKS81]